MEMIVNKLNFWYKNRGKISGMKLQAAHQLNIYSIPLETPPPTPDDCLRRIQHGHQRSLCHLTVSLSFLRFHVDVVWS